MKQLTISGGLALTGFHFPFKNRYSEKSLANNLPEQLNFLFIITDQERHTQYFPDGWEEANLPNLMRLKNNGLTFTNAFCNSCMCSPSRSTMMTGLYPAQHQVTDTLPEAEGEPNSQQETELDANLQNIVITIKKYPIIPT